MAQSNDNLYPMREGNMVSCPCCKNESIGWCLTCIYCGYDFDAAEIAAKPPEETMEVAV